MEHTNLLSFWITNWDLLWRRHETKIVTVDKSAVLSDPTTKFISSRFYFKAIVSGGYGKATECFIQKAPRVGHPGVLVGRQLKVSFLVVAIMSSRGPLEFVHL